MSRKIFLYFSSLLLLNLACSLLAGPPAIVIPTPPPTVPSFNVSAPSGEVVFDPVSDIVPAVDPVIQNLMNNVSQQQLLGYVQALEGFGTRSSFSVVDRQDWGVGAARLMIYNEFIRVGNGRLIVQFDDFPMNVNGLVTNQQNVIATLPGTSPHLGVIVLMAHYDSRTSDPFDGESRAPGANDNATGVAVLLETARLLSSQTWNQTVVFVAFAGEEQGRYGSNHFVSDKILSGWLIDSAFNNDIVGGRPGIPQSIRVFSPGPDTNPSRHLARYLDLVSGLYLPTFAITLEDGADRPDRYSDHMTFQNAGIPALRLTESLEDPNRQHNSRDTSDAIDYSYLMQVVQLNLVTVANAIGAPPVPQIPQVAPMADAGSYILTWPVDSLAAAYAISFRPLGQNEFAPFRFVNAAQAGNIAITGLDPTLSYALSIAAIDGNGRIGLFTAEIPVGASGQ